MAINMCAFHIKPTGNDHKKHCVSPPVNLCDKCKSVSLSVEKKKLELSTVGVPRESSSGTKGAEVRESF